MHDIKRSAVSAVSYLLKHFPCVVVLGARQVGKTTLLKQVLPNKPFFDLESRTDCERIQRDPEFFLSQQEGPTVIDEAQTLPALFSALRVAIDRHRDKKGLYLLSGSSSPDLLKHITESLAGRAAIFELSGFGLEEAWKLPVNPLYDLLAKKNAGGILALKPRLDNNRILESCLFGSYPEPFLTQRKDTKAFYLWMENYFTSYIRRDIRNLFPGLNIENYQKFVAMLAGASGQLLNASDFARSLDISQPTVKSYFQIAHGTFVWRLLPSFHKNISKRVIKMPKGHMRDTGLLNHILHIGAAQQLQSHPAYGRIWETFIIEELLKGFGNALLPVAPFFYRTTNNAEIDLILEGDFGLLPIEIKAGSLTASRNLIALEQFIHEQKLPFGLVINNSLQPAWLTPKILQIPAGYL